LNFYIFDTVSKKEQTRFKGLIIKTSRERTSNNEHIKTNTARVEVEVRWFAGEAKIEWSKGEPDWE
jgi:hypothetical protein